MMAFHYTIQFWIMHWKVLNLILLFSAILRKKMLSLLANDLALLKQTNIFFPSTGCMTWFKKWEDTHCISWGKITYSWKIITYALIIQKYKIQLNPGGDFFGQAVYLLSLHLEIVRICSLTDSIVRLPGEHVFVQISQEITVFNYVFVIGNAHIKTT